MAQDNPGEIKFDLIKGNFFRVIHADGVYGGSTPQRQLAISFFNERFPIPQQVTQLITPDGSLGSELLDKRVVRDAVIREIEVCVLLNFEVAARLHEWLGAQLAKSQTIMAKENKATNDR